MESHSSDEIIKDVFNWLFDFSTPFLVMWIHDETVTQTILVAQVVAGILAKLGKLSASFFSGLEGIVNARHVIPTLAYQLTQSRPEVRTHVGQAVAQDNSIFNLEIETQLRKLLCDPLLAVSESGVMKPQGIGPDVFLIHGLENYNEDYFQSPFLQDFVDVLHLVRATNTPHRLLIIGRHTSFLQSCTSKPNMRQTILERPMTTTFWFGKEEEISFWNEEAQRREEDLKRREEGLRQKEEALRELGERLDTKGENMKAKDEDIERRRCALQLDEEKVRTREDDFLLLDEELSRREDEVSRREYEMRKQGDKVRGTDREAKQRQGTNGDLNPLIQVDSGIRIIRQDKELESAPLNVPQLFHQTPVVMETQEELDARRALRELSAGEAIFEKMDELQEKHKREMEVLKKEVEEEDDENDEQLKAKLEGERRKLEETMVHMEERQKRLVMTWTGQDTHSALGAESEEVAAEQHPPPKNEQKKAKANPNFLQKRTDQVVQKWNSSSESMRRARENAALENENARPQSIIGHPEHRKRIAMTSRKTRSQLDAESKAIARLPKCREPGEHSSESRHWESAVHGDTSDALAVNGGKVGGKYLGAFGTTSGAIIGRGISALATARREVFGK